MTVPAGRLWLTPVIVATQSGGRDQEEQGLKTAQANSLRALSQKYPSLKELAE
jgi:hypothetical protein